MLLTTLKYLSFIAHLLVHETCRVFCCCLIAAFNSIRRIWTFERPPTKSQIKSSAANSSSPFRRHFPPISLDACGATVVRYCQRDCVRSWEAIGMSDQIVATHDGRAISEVPGPRGDAPIAIVGTGRVEAACEFAAGIGERCN